jgi:CYTH domain-containing protein
MKTNIKGKIEVVIEEINVEEGEYEIHYKYSFDGKIWESDVYGSDFEGWTIKEWEKELKNGEAIKTVMQHVAESIE